VLRRRFGRLIKEEEEATIGRGPPAIRPDLVLIDGGHGPDQRGDWRSWRDLGVDDHRPSWASPRARTATPGWSGFFIPGKPYFMLEPKSPILFYLQRLRDEAHRFAIGTHRAQAAPAR